MTNNIHPDLYRTIVEFVGPKHLRDLSRASPIFDQVICNMGLRVIYDYTKTVVLDDHHIVIRTTGGILRVLQKNGSMYKSTRKSKYHCSTIQFDGPVDYSKKYCRTADNKIWLCIGQDEHTNVIMNTDVKYPDFDDAKLTVSFREVSHRFDYLTIDIESEWIMSYSYDYSNIHEYNHGYEYDNNIREYNYVFTKFKVIFKDGRWQ